MKKGPLMQDMFTKEELDSLVAKNNMERKLVNEAIKKLGNLTNVKELAKYTSMSKSTIYNLIDLDMIFVYKALGGKRIIIFTESIVNIFRS